VVHARRPSKIWETQAKIKELQEDNMFNELGSLFNSPDFPPLWVMVLGLLVIIFILRCGDTSDDLNP